VRSGTIPARQDDLSTSRVALWILAAVLLLVALSPGPAQDLASFRVGAALARSAPADVYPRADFDSLFAVTPRFRAAALADDPRQPPASVTGFVATPPTLLLPFSAGTAPVATWVWRVLAAVGAASALLRLHDRVVAPDARTAFALLATLCFPVLGYGVWLGQTAWLWLVLATFLAERAGREQAREGLAIAALSLFKVTPLVVLVPLALRRRWGAVGVAAGVVCGAVAASLVLLSPSLWADFARTSLVLGTHVIPDWNNASVEALLVRTSTGATSRLVAIQAPVAAVGLMLRLGLWIWTIRTRRTDVALLAACASTPLLWTHTLAVAPALLAPSLESQPRAVWLTGGLVLGSVVLLPFVSPGWVALVSSLAVASLGGVLALPRPVRYCT
jgi:hypothetical protein